MRQQTADCAGEDVRERDPQAALHVVTELPSRSAAHPGGRAGGELMEQRASCRGSSRAARSGGEALRRLTADGADLREVALGDLAVHGGKDLVADALAMVAGEDGAQILPAARDAAAGDEALERTGGGTGGGAGAHHIFLIGIGCTCLNDLPSKDMPARGVTVSTLVHLPAGWSTAAGGRPD
jgi:hypothetical protein